MIIIVVIISTVTVQFAASDTSVSKARVRTRCVTLQRAVINHVDATKDENPLLPAHIGAVQRDKDPRCEVVKNIAQEK